MNYELAEWRDNGAEQTAEVIAWGVSDRAAPTVQIADDGCADLRSGYLTLTGVEPPHGLISLCGPPRGRIAVSFRYLRVSREGLLVRLLGPVDVVGDDGMVRQSGSVLRRALLALLA